MTHPAPHAFDGGSLATMAGRARARAVGQSGRRGMRRWAERGVTLIELLVAIALVGLLTSSMMLGMGALAQARLKRSSTLIAGAVKVAYNHANSTARPTRLVFDFDARTVSLEQGEGPMLLRRGEKTGGALGATEAEQQAEAAAAEIADGPRAPRPGFQPVKATGLPGGSDAEGKTLADGIHFRQVEVEHEEEPVTSGRVYLYFWPGGQTEHAAVQLMLGSNAEAVDDDDVITLTVAPLTGKVSIVAGAQTLQRPKTDEEESERDDTGF